MTTKTSMALLTEYGGDSSEDEVPGPRVSTKRTFREDSDPDSASPPQRLPVPAHFITKNEDEPKDDPALHEGRLRSFAHERGNWATFVYIPFEAKPGLLELCSYIKETMPSHLEVKISEDFHISLTKTVVLKYHWITPFMQSLKEHLGVFRKYLITARANSAFKNVCCRFIILLKGIKVYCNEERTRTFIGVQIKSGYDTLLSFVNVLDRCLNEFNLPCFYKDPSFHISIAWFIGDLQRDLEAYVAQVNNKFIELMDIYSEDNFYILAESIMCKSGNKYFQFVLS
ncbi:U6 snRNA phosphodiesterase 1 isoform X1 [Euwallacea fornicatus]|uniref:U6 snRNA phosphodiesterase 1 isoform X1 n=1 Tax=Euwallacea fornicatus TaxID=995702 RepID=UPI00338F6182